MINMTEYVTISAKISIELRNKLKELGIKPSIIIKKAIEEEIKNKMKEKIDKKRNSLDNVFKKLDKNIASKIIRESRDER